MFDLGLCRFNSIRLLAVFGAASLIAVALPGAALAHTTERKWEPGGSMRSESNHTGHKDGRSERVGAAYTQSNDPTANTVYAFDRYANGKLKFAQSIATGGKGGLQPQPGCDPPGGCPILDTQGEVALTSNGKLLFVVNAGSNTITSFKVSDDGLKRRSTIDSGGQFPNSLTIHGNLLYVLNANSANIAGFTFNASGAMSAISGSSQPLVGTVIPGLARQIGFDNTGKTLIATLLGNPGLTPPVATQSINSFPVAADGAAGPGTAYDASSPFPFGFAFDPSNHLIVSQVTDLMTPGAGKTGSYSLSSTGAVTQVNAAASSGTAPCWVSITSDGKYAFVVNTGGGAPDGSTVTRYSIAADGSLTELGSNAETKSEFAKTDSLLSSDSRFLYVLAPSVKDGDTSRIDEYKGGGGGSLTLIGQTPANMPVGVSGLAGR